MCRECSPLGASTGSELPVAEEVVVAGFGGHARAWPAMPFGDGRRPVPGPVVGCLALEGGSADACESSS
jgi:hypothetical protein